jgi:hypothetical protein
MRVTNIGLGDADNYCRLSQLVNEVEKIEIVRHLSLIGLKREILRSIYCGEGSNPSATANPKSMLQHI